MKETFSQKYRRYKSLGLCRCGRQLANGKSSCSTCILKVALRRAEKEDAGLCCETGCYNDRVEGMVHCIDCINKRNIKKAEKKSLGLCEITGCTNERRLGKVLCVECAKVGTDRTRRIKQIVFNHYGQKCNCPCGCGVTKFEWLTIDHKNNDGARRRNTDGTGYSLYLYIIKSDFPDDLQILCWNCNCSKGFYGDCK